MVVGKYSGVVAHIKVKTRKLLAFTAFYTAMLWMLNGCLLMQLSAGRRDKNC